MKIKTRFTLIELIVSITVLGILLAIVLLNISSSKKDAIRSAMQSNIKIIQTSVDSYYLKNESYPIKNEYSLTLSKPQLIDIDILERGQYLKKGLDTSKIKTQYYWVDSFGKVWGSTSNDLHSINLYKNLESKSLEFIIGESIEGYNIYEVSGYSDLLSYSKNKDLIADKNSSKKKYKMVEETSVSGSGSKVLNFDFPNQDSNYLISAVDEYGLETAPFGPFSTPNISGFEPLLNKTGVYEFEILGNDIMYWINFKYLINTPGESSVTFDFKVKDSDGIYKAWEGDFFALDPSMGITVRVDMRGDDKGNKPSLYDLRVLFKYKDKETPTLPVLDQPVVPQPTDFTCPETTVVSSLSRFTTKKETGDLAYLFYIEEGTFFSPEIAPKVNFAAEVSYSINSIKYLVSMNNLDYIDYDKSMKVSGKCMVVLYNVSVEGIPSSERINEHCEATNSCSIEYCVAFNNCPINPTCLELGNCPNYQSCEDLGTCSDKPSCLELGNCKPSNSTTTCGSGGSLTSYSFNLKGKFVYNYILKENESISKLDIKSNFSGFVITNIYLEFSSGGNPYKIATSVLDVPSGSCVKIVYEVTKILAYCSDCLVIEPPVIETCIDLKDCPALCLEDCKQTTPLCIINCESKPSWCDFNDCNKDREKCIDYKGECVPPVCTVNCTNMPPNLPDPKDKELTDPEWTTVERVRFFGHGASNQLTRWYKSEHTDSINQEMNSDEISLSETEDTRIVYRYAKSNSYYWSSEYIDFANTGVARSVLGISYIQVKTDRLKDLPTSEYPTVLSMRFYNEQGYLDASMTQPTLALTPTKDNNLNREVFSDESNIEWSYMAVDPRNKEIVDIEWRGDKRDKYPVGTYLVEARVKNEVEIWSEWTSYELKIVQEKPIAEIDYIRTKEGDNYFYRWNINKSKDPDGDIIIDFEFKNAKESYSLGEQLVEARVKDSEGYWSDWVSLTLKVIDEGFKIYRLEAEAALNKDKQLESYATAKTPIPEFSGGEGVIYQHNGGGFVMFTFEGTGFDFFTTVKNKTKVYYEIDGGSKLETTVGLHSFRGLDYGIHTLKVYLDSNFLDYVDVYSSNDRVSYTPIKTRILNSGIEGLTEFNIFSSQLNQTIKHYYEVEKDAHEKISILSETGETVRVLSDKNVLGGTYRNHSVSWNGLNSKNEEVLNGKYFIQFDFTGVNGTKSSYRKEVYVLNEIPIYRLEAEAALDKDKQLTAYASRVTSIPEFSNGLGVEYVHNAGGFISFNFEGTGFDFFTKVKNVNIVEFQLNNGPLTKVPVGLYSLRDLPYGSYSLKIYLDSNYLDYVDVYSNNDKVVNLGIQTRVLNLGSEGLTEYNTFSTKLSQSIKHYYEVDKNSKETITILSENKSLVRTISSKNVLGGTSRSHSVVWDGLDSKGKELPNGKYFINFEYIGINGTKSVYQKEVFILNERPIYRLEAESALDLDKQLSFYAATKTSIPEFSGGEGVTYQHNAGGYILFTFEGTGFDFSTKVRSLDIVRYELNGGPSVQVPAGLYSLRDLPYQTHMLKIYLNSNYLDYVDIYSSNDKVSISEGDTKIIHANIESSSNYNVLSSTLNQSIKHYYTLDKNTVEKVTIVSQSGVVVRTLREGPKLGGTSRNYSVIWDGKGDNGEILPNGKYYLTVETLGIYNSKGLYRKEIELLNLTPFERIEAESSDSRISGKYGIRISEDSTLSGGKGLTRGGTSNPRITVEFKGTGFDIKTIGSTTTAVTYSLNGGAPVTVSSNLYSLRNLPNQTHKITINYRETTLDYLEVY